MKFYSQIFLFVALTISYSFSQNYESFYASINSIKSDSILKHLKYLASDELEGRGLGTKGIDLAAKYISEKFNAYELKKIPDKNSYFQEIPFVGSLPLKTSELKFYLEEEVKLLKFSEDYFLYNTGQQTFIPVPLEIVFVGYGIVAPEYDYNDYQTVDVTGKIVAFISDEPLSNDDFYFEGKLPTKYSSPEMKRQIALSRGAAGTILIPCNECIDWERIKNEYVSEDINLAYAVTKNLSVIINPESADLLFKDSGYDYEDVKTFHLTHKMISFPLKTKLSFRGAFRERTFIDKNVIGILPGSDEKLKDSYIIISAHYDHLGIGETVDGDSIYNGALDNAIGVASLIELARVFSQMNIKPKRTIVFIAFTAEEKGLLGSIYYTDNPVFPLYKTIANINIDGMAFFRDFQSIVGIGSEYSTLKKNLNETAERFKLVVEDIPPEFKPLESLTSSDHFSFAVAGVPSIIILEGLENRTRTKEEVLKAFVTYFQNKYHTPFDDLNQFIDLIAIEKHTKIIFDFTYYLSNSYTEPGWNQNSPFLKARLRSIAEKR